MTARTGRRAPAAFAAGIAALTLACAGAPPAPAPAPRAASAPRPEPGSRPEHAARAPAQRAALAPAGEAEPVAPPALPEDPLVASVRDALAAEAPEVDGDSREAIARQLAALQHEAGIPALLVLGLIEQESRFDPDAVGPRGALGLMQLRPFVAEAVAARHGVAWRGRATLLDPARNVEIGCAYLTELKRRFGELSLALAAYNKGPTRVARELRRGHEPGLEFISLVMRRYDALDVLYGLDAPTTTSLPAAAAQ